MPGITIDWYEPVRYEPEISTGILIGMSQKSIQGYRLVEARNQYWGIDWCETEISTGV